MSCRLSHKEPQHQVKSSTDKQNALPAYIRQIQPLHQARRRPRRQSQRQNDPGQPRRQQQEHPRRPPPPFHGAQRHNDARSRPDDRHSQHLQPRQKHRPGVQSAQRRPQYQSPPPQRQAAEPRGAQQKQIVHNAVQHHHSVPIHHCHPPHPARPIIRPSPVRTRRNRCASVFIKETHPRRDVFAACR